jgi:hypothetical protein
MRTSIPIPQRKLGLWLLAFFSPTLYFLLLLLGDRFHVTPPPEKIVGLLFYVIPLVALLVCERAVWLSDVMTGRKVGRKVGWMLLTLLAMLLQFGVILAIIVSATGYVQ